MAGLNLFTNNAATTLASALTNVATSLTVVTGQGAEFPNPAGSQYFYCTLANNLGAVEIIKVTARSGDTFTTIVRAQDGTTAASWSAGDKVELRLVNADLTNFGQLDSTNTWALAQTFSSPVATGSGGTGLSSFTSGGAVYATSTSALTTGTLPIASGGTNATATPTAGGSIYGTGTAYAVTAAGTAGQVLTSNGASAPTWSTVSSAGGATETTTSADITLTSSSNRLQKAIQSGSGNSFILPNATTIGTPGANIFQLVNSGSSTQQMYIENNSGGFIYKLSVGESVPIGLSNNSNANTGWTVNDSDGYYQRTLPTVVTTGTVWADFYGTISGVGIDSLSSTASIISYSILNTTSGFMDVYAVVATRSGNTFTFGTPLLIYSGTASTSQAGPSSVVALSSTTALIQNSIINSTSPTSIQIFGLTISGTTITKTATALVPTGTAVMRMRRITSTQAVVCTSTNAISGSATIGVVQHNGTSVPTSGTFVAAFTAVSPAAPGNAQGAHDFNMQSATKGYFATGQGNIATFTIAGTVVTMGAITTQTINDSSGPVTADQIVYAIFPVSTTEAAVITDSGLATYTVSGTTTTLVSASNNPSHFGTGSFNYQEWWANPTNIYFNLDATTIINTRGEMFKFISGKGLQQLAIQSNLASFGNEVYAASVCTISGSTNKFAVIGFPEDFVAGNNTTISRAIGASMYIMEPVA